MIHLSKTITFGFQKLKNDSLKFPFNLCFRLRNNFSTFSDKGPNDSKKNPEKLQTKFTSKSSADNQNDKKLQTDQSEKEQIQFTPNEQSLIKAYQPDEVFNLYMNLDSKHNFQKELIIAKKQYERSTKQLRANILFEDLLKSEFQIPVYDTKGKPYTHMWMKNIFNIMFFGLTVWFFNAFAESSPKNKVILEKTSAGKAFQSLLYGFSGWFLVVGFFRYFKFQRRFVQKIVYDTKSENFILTKRKAFGGSTQKEVSRFKIVYTENEFLNKKGTNYFNLETKEQYSIPYKESWLKQDLFSHLISQRIRV